MQWGRRCRAYWWQVSMDAPQHAMHTQADFDKHPSLQPRWVCNERPAVPGRIQRALIFSCKRDGNNRTSWFRASAVKDKYENAVYSTRPYTTCSHVLFASVTATTVHLGSVHLQPKTNSRTPSTFPDWSPSSLHTITGDVELHVTGVPFNDTYRFMD